jgi:transposase InsO family protein
MLIMSDAVMFTLSARQHRLTAPRSPTTTGKVERFHGSLRRELLDDAVPFAGLAALDVWQQEYNTTRPHQSLSMASPAGRLRARGQRRQDLSPAAGRTSRPRPVLR